jgi:hypothetical protein
VQYYGCCGTSGNIIVAKNTESAMQIDREKDIKYLQVQKQDDGEKRQ